MALAAFLTGPLGDPRVSFCRCGTGRRGLRWRSVLMAGVHRSQAAGQQVPRTETESLAVSAGLDPVRISFDLDDTLVCRNLDAPADSGWLPGRFHRWCAEPLRRGTRALMHELRRGGCSIWIYTTSGRTPFHIRLWLLLHGIRVDGVVNGERHRQELAGHTLARLPSKYPPAFNINLHVDDSEGVRMEGDAHGFRVVVVRPDDDHWTQRVLEAAMRAPAPRLEVGHSR